MPINPSIAMGYQAPQIESPLNAYAKFAQIQNAQQANELARMQSQEYARGLQEQEGLRNYLAGRPDLSSSESQSELMKYGKPGLGMLESAAKLRKEQTEAKIKSEDLIGKTYSRFKSELDSAESPAQLAAVHSSMFTDEVLGPVLKTMGRTPDSGLAAIQNAKTPEDFYALKLRMAEGTQKFLDASKNQILQQVSGTGTRMVAFNPLTNQLTVVPGSESQAAIAPGQQATQDIARQRLGIEQAGLELKQQEAANKNAVTISPKEIQKREAVFPQATSALKGFEAKTDSFISDLKKLRDHPGLNQITGLIAGRIPALTDEGRAAQALYDKVVAKGGFQALQDLREASKTGGALGNVSNQEGKQLTASFAAIDRRQNAKDVQNAIDEAIGSIEGSKVRMREAYDSTYDYRNKGMETNQSQPAAPARPAGGVKFLGFE